MSRIFSEFSKPRKAFWRMPVNIDQFDPVCVNELIESDLYPLLRPTEVDTPRFQSTSRGTGIDAFLSDTPLCRIAERRVSDLTKFLRDAALVTRENAELKFKNVKFAALAGDSHNGGKRPLAMEFGASRMVLKFADPRPYQLLAAVLKELSRNIGVELGMPEITPGYSNEWYLIANLKADEVPHTDPAGFIYTAGALTASAYCLRITDLHYENLMVTNGRLIIIDPECLPYVFGSREVRQRLLDTRLLSKDPIRSGLRGGDQTGKDIFNIDVHERADGVLCYRKPARPPHNRAIDANGKFIDPACYREVFIAGYDAAYRWFIERKKLVTDILETKLNDGFRIRYLMRDTKHYVSVIHMLNLPSDCSYDEWRDGILKRFRRSGNFPPDPNAAALEAELSDIDARDVPYFWVNAEDNWIRHRIGPIQRTTLDQSPRDQVVQDIYNLSIDCLPRQIEVIDELLNINVRGR